MAGQPLSVRNSDQTLHNVHTYKGASTIFNQAEIPGLPPMMKKFDGPSSIMKFKCDVHPWMTGYVAVTDHPFFAVTGDDGSFTIPNVPAGTYTIEAWHERFGTTTAEVTVVEGQAGRRRSDAGRAIEIRSLSISRGCKLNQRRCRRQDPVDLPRALISALFCFPRYKGVRKCPCR